jgi:hypothetical protein
MATPLGLLRSRAAYFFFVVGAAWAGVGVYTGSTLVAWPAVACLAGGALLKLFPGRRLTWAWGVATASMGGIISLYQVYAWEPLLGGAFSGLAAASMAGFALFTVVHLLLLYAGAGTGPLRSETSPSTS